ncbi:MAG: hypothetical protein SOR57_09585 [Parabacteroides sp.]|nr:hypothetical protein [Parabacteroides sp.]
MKSFYILTILMISLMFSSCKKTEYVCLDPDLALANTVFIGYSQDSTYIYKIAFSGVDMTFAYEVKNTVDTQDSLFIGSIDYKFPFPDISFNNEEYDGVELTSLIVFDKETLKGEFNNGEEIFFRKKDDIYETN